MRFDLVRPYPSCPFRPDVVPYVRPDRMAAILHSVLVEGCTFTCHNAVTGAVDGDPYRPGLEGVTQRFLQKRP